MKYTQTITQPFNFVPLGKSTPTFKQLNIDVGKTALFFVTSTLKGKSKLHCSRDDDYIEVPGGSDTVPYTDEDGNQYEIPLDDLIEYDGDDGEIQYTKSKGKNIPLVAMHHIKDKPNYYLNMIMTQQMMQRVYGQA